MAHVDVKKYFHGEKFTEEERAEMRARVCEYARLLIENQDYPALQSLTARLSCTHIDTVIHDYIIVSSALSSDIALIHALQFIEHNEAMNGCGRSWRG